MVYVSDFREGNSPVLIKLRNCLSTGIVIIVIIIRGLVLSLIWILLVIVIAWNRMWLMRGEWLRILGRKNILGSQFIVI
jgi:hypothetical protein